MQYLALGDSYTIGERVSYEKNFPSQTAQLLTQQGIPCSLKQLIAVTGWTSEELLCAIAAQKPSHNFDLVTLLIGVNNQYREQPVDTYRWQFYSLLCQAILYARGLANRVIVLSIPDWGLTPFNTQQDTQKVSTAIDSYNVVNREITQTMGCHYLDVTPSSRMHAQDEYYLADDKLHYSEHEYAIWAAGVSDLVVANRHLWL